MEVAQLLAHLFFKFTLLKYFFYFLEAYIFVCLLNKEMYLKLNKVFNSKYQGFLSSICHNENAHFNSV